MGSISLNRILRIHLQLQSRNVAVSWLRRGCSSSASTVRCIQSDSTTPQIKNSQVPVSLASLLKKKPNEEPCDGSGQEQLETVCGNASEKRLNKTASLPNKKTKMELHKDNDLQRPESVCRNASENRLLKTVNLDESSSSKEKEISKSTLKDAEKVAIGLLARRAFSVAELRKKLHGKKFPLQVVDKVIADIKARELVNDGLYAESFSRSRWLSSTWGPRRIKQALVQKGVSEVDVNKATRKVFEDDDHDHDDANHKHNEDSVHPDESGSGNTQLIMSESSMDRLFVQASKQWLRGQDLSQENRKARVVRWLQYRGFNWGVVAAILKRLQSQFTNFQDDGNTDNRKNNNDGGSSGSGSSNKKIVENISEESMEKVLKEVAKQWIKGQDAPIENRKARIARWLRYRGYNWEVVGVILKKLQSQ